jgi:hypothetical protein
MKWRDVFVDKERRFALIVDEESGRSFVSIPVQNSMVEYEEYYEVDPATFERFTADPTTSHDFVDKAKRRELDHLLLLPPGTDRGEPI